MTQVLLILAGWLWAEPELAARAWRVGRHGLFPVAGALLGGSAGWAVGQAIARRR